MLSIGEFSRLAGVSVRALRHYDERGLLEPATVDPSSGYRSYTMAQLGRLNRIVVLKELGFSLHQVANVLREDFGDAEMRALLRARRAQTAADLAATEASLLRIENRLAWIDDDPAYDAIDVVIKTCSPAVAVTHAMTFDELDPDLIPAALTRLFTRCWESITRAGIAPAGPMIALYDSTASGVTVTAALPISGSAAVASAGVGSAGVDVGSGRAVEIASATVATHIVTGDLGNAATTWQRLAAWAESHRYEPTGQSREVYLECGADGEPQTTELQYAIAEHPENERHR